MPFLTVLPLEIILIVLCGLVHVPVNLLEVILGDGIGPVLLIQLIHEDTNRKLPLEPEKFFRVGFVPLQHRPGIRDHDLFEVKYVVAVEVVVLLDLAGGHTVLQRQALKGIVNRYFV